MKYMQLDQRAIWEHIQMQQSASHRGITHMHQATYHNFPQGQPNPYMPSNQFGAYVAWPGDKFYYSRDKFNI